MRINEGPRSRWLTGEIYVSEGLEDALNIDRDSFNKFHPQYKALQTYIHNILQKTIFPRVYKQIEVRSEKRAGCVYFTTTNNTRQTNGLARSVGFCCEQNREI